MRWVVVFAVMALASCVGGDTGDDPSPEPRPAAEPDSEPEPAEDGAAGGACFGNGTCNDGLECVDDVCEAIPEGTLDGPCYGNGTCNEGLDCVDDRCVTAEENICDNPDNYDCGPNTYVECVDDEPRCFCEEGYRPSGDECRAYSNAECCDCLAAAMVGGQPCISDAEQCTTALDNGSNIAPTAGCANDQCAGDCWALVSQD